MVISLRLYFAGRTGVRLWGRLSSLPTGRPKSLLCKSERANPCGADFPVCRQTQNKGGTHMTASKQTGQPVYFYRRRLPHWQPPGATIFITRRLFGSLPQEALDRLAAERHRLGKQRVRPNESPRDGALRHSKRLFALAHEMLAKSTAGPHWLKDERIAPLVVDALFHHHGGLYTLVAFVVMSNHVHVVLTPLEEDGGQAGKPAPQQAQAEVLSPRYVPLRRITQAIKGYTAREANRLLSRTGQPFWQDESYDHWARDEAELERIVVYTEGDPVRSGLVASPEEWRWSSAWERKWGRMKDWPW